MILILDAIDGIRTEDLLARPSKSGSGPARGPAVDSRDGAPLASLRDGDKLHLVAQGNQDQLAGYTAPELVACLAALGLHPDVRLKQIHLIAAHTGAADDASFAAAFAAALQSDGFQVPEIKAPKGDVRCDSAGKIWILWDHIWQPSSPELNYYAGPAVQDKHRKNT